MSSQQYKGPIHLTKEMYDTLMSTGSVVDEHGVTHTYEDGHEYITDEIDYVDLTSSQDVEGVKTFLNGIKIGADTTKLTGVENSAPVSGSTKAITSGAVYSTLSGKAPTSHASSSSTYGLGTTSNYGHVKLATGDMNNATGSDGVACGKNHTHGQYMPYGAVLMPTNPFGGKSLYINSVDNAFASADKKFYVTITRHSISSGGVTYPYIDSSKSVTDDDYFVDGPVVGTMTSSAHDLFNGSYEGGLSVSDGQYMKIRIMFGSNTSPSASTSYFPGYPYGVYYLSYYYTSVPTQVSQYRVYNKFSAHTVGWHLYNFSAFNGTLGNVNYIEQVNDGGNYQRSCVEFIIYGRSGGSTSITEIDYRLTRPDLARDGSTLTKYGSQNLYHQFTWYNDHAETAKITPEGYIYGSTLYEGGTSLANKYVARTTGSNKVYATDNSGNQTTLSIGTANGNAAIYRDSGSGTSTPNGYLVSHDPSNSYHVATKKYADERVTANPSGTSNTDLTKISIGGTVYNIPSGGSGGSIYMHKFYLDDILDFSVDVQFYVLSSSSTPYKPSAVSDFNSLITTLTNINNDGVDIILENTMYYQGYNIPYSIGKYSPTIVQVQYLNSSFSPITLDIDESFFNAHYLAISENIAEL